MLKYCKFIVTIICESCGKKNELMISEKQLNTWKSIWRCSCGAIPYKYDEVKKVWFCKSFINK